MSQTDTIIRFEPDGPAGTGLQPWEDMNPETLISGTPVQNGHTWHAVEASGYLAGVWDCTEFVDHPGPYPVDEFMLLLQGSVVMVMPDGNEVRVEAGQAFVLPKGLQCQWKQPGYVRKFFMILDGPVPAHAANPALGRVTLPDLSAPPLPDGALEASQTVFVNAAGNMQVRTRHLTAAQTPEHPAGANHLVHVLAGGLHLSQGGTTRRFAAGDTAYIIQGSPVGWQSEAGTKLLQASCRL